VALAPFPALATCLWHRAGAELRDTKIVALFDLSQVDQRLAATGRRI